MKIAIIGIEYKQGKTNLKDERLDKVKELTKCPGQTYIQLELIDSARISEADAIICSQEKKTDLIIEDLESVEKLLASAADQDKISKISRLKEELEKDNILSKCVLQDDLPKDILGYNLITLKPVYIIGSDISNIEDILLNAYKEFGHISFFTTVGSKEARAWCVKYGTTCYEAAGKIHSTIQKGFIRAEVISYEDLVKSGGVNEAKAQNLMRLEDKEYIVKDADWLNFRFNK